MKSHWATKFFSAIMIVLLALAAMPVRNVSADDTGWIAPTNVQSSNWTNATNGLVSDNVWATEGSDNDDVVYNDFGISIPTGYQIDGIEVSVEGYTSGTRDINVSLSWTATGNNWTNDTFLNFTDNSGSDQTLIAGGPTNTWGENWTPAEISVLRVWLETDNDSGTFNLDQVTVKVYYSAIPEIEVYGNGISITDGDNNPSTNDITDFGNVGVGIPISRTFTIVNNGTADLTIGAITFSSGGSLNPGDFLVTSSPTSPVPPGGFTTFTIQLTAVGGGGDNTRNTVVNIVTNDANENPFNFAIEGNRISTGPEIEVYGNGVEIDDGDGSSTAAGSDWGDVGQGVPVTRTFTIYNTGAANLTIAGISFSSGAGLEPADFSVVNAPAATVAAGGSTTFTIQLTAGAGGSNTRNTVLNIDTNDTNEDPFNFAIEGNRITGAPEIEVLGNNVSITDGGGNTPSFSTDTNFGIIAMGSNAVKTYTIRNNGSTNLTINTASFVFGSSDFTLLTAPTTPVTAGNSTTFQVQFAPTTTGVINSTITFTNNDPGGEASFTFDLTGMGASSIDSVANDDTATVTEDAAATTINVRGNDTDADSAVELIQSVSDPAGGTVVITNGGADLTYQPDANFCNGGTPTDDFTYTLAGGDSATVAVTVTCVDDISAANDDTASVAEDAAATTINVRGNDTDADSAVELIQSVSDPAGGTVVITNGGADLTYQPDANFCNGGTPTDDFTYTLAGGDSATVAVTVTCVDDISAANDDTATVTEDAAATTINVRGNDTDADSAVELIQSVSDPTGGAVVITNGGADLTYQPDANFCNGGTPTDDFTYTLAGGDSATVAVTVTCVDDISIANDDTASVAEDSGATTINVRGNDSDIDSTVELIQSVSDPTGGAVVITNGGADLTYQPDANFCNGGTPTDDFTYTLAGGDSATVAVTVTCVDDISIANDDTASVAEDSGATTINVRGNDSDIDSTVELIQSVSDPTGGAVVITNGGADLTYQPDANFCNGGTPTDDFTYTLAGGDSATVAVTVTCINDAPVFTAGDDQTVNEDAGAQSVPGWATGILAGPANESGQTLTFNITGNDNPGLFSAGPTVAADGTLTYTPANNAFGSANITLALSDNGGTANGGVDTSAPQSFVITVNPVDDAPVSSNVIDTTNEDTPQTITLAYMDVEGDPAISCSVFGISNGSISTACACSLVGVCTVGLTPATNSTTSVTANFTVDNGQVSNTSNITLNVNAVNDAPVTSNVNDTTNEDTEQIITLSYIDTEGDFANSCSVTGVANGSVTTACACAAGVCTVGLTPASNSVLQVTADYTVDDGAVSNTSNITLNVTPVDDNPVAVDDPVTVPGNAATIIDVLGNDTDVDGGPMNVASTGVAANGTVTNNTTNVTYEPNTNYCGTDSFTYTLNGGSTATVNVTVACSPVFTSADNTAFDFGFPGTFDVTATGNPALMTISMTGAPAGITLLDNGDGTATLTGDGTTPVGVYNLIFTADNTVSPNGIQNFTLSIRNGPFLTLINSAPDTGNGSISENEAISNALGITQIMVEFDRDVYDDPADLVNFDDDVTNPDNYLLVRSVTGTFATTSCTSGTGSDVIVNINSVTYSNNGGSGPFIATLNINDGFPLNVEGFYKLFVCGSTSIVDATNQGLSLAGDGANPGTDFVRNFRIAAPATGGGGDDDNGGGNATRNATIASSISQGGVLIPVTGFTPNQVTALPAQSAEYAASKLTLEIPSISLNLPVVGVEFKDNTWDVTWLGGNAGYLEGSAYPTWTGNTILTGHVTNPNGKPGSFAHLTDLKPGQKIYIHNNGFVYVYEVRKSSLIAPSAIKTLFKHEDDTWLSLVTCENFSDATGKFTHRRLVRAVLISIIPEK